MGVRYELSRNWWFLPNGDFMVSWYIGSRVNLISSRRNYFYDFCSISSLITLPCQHFNYVASHLIRIKIIINISLGLPLGVMEKIADTKTSGGSMCTRLTVAPDSINCSSRVLECASRLTRVFGSSY